MSFSLAFLFCFPLPSRLPSSPALCPCLIVTTAIFLLRRPFWAPLPPHPAPFVPPYLTLRASYHLPSNVSHDSAFATFPTPRGQSPVVICSHAVPPPLPPARFHLRFSLDAVLRCSRRCCAFLQLPLHFPSSVSLLLLLRLRSPAPFFIDLSLSRILLRHHPSCLFA